MTFPYPNTVEEAAKQLDEYMPNWHTKIDIDTLSMGSFDRCIIGQLNMPLKHISIISEMYGSDYHYYWYTHNKPFGHGDNQKSKWLNEISKRNVSL